eukprot:GDKI01018913.1.p1 GENE.GDKI01018913.1~~GDKI01018913.1.p1  ORF type:complete len:819 (-),score=255.43 GDKI01018913.1:28-2484(-)
MPVIEKREEVSASPPHDSHRFALVIGCCAYTYGTKLGENVKSEAEAVHKMLKTAGKFKSTLLFDATKEEMEGEVQALKAILKARDPSHPPPIVCAFFAGHGACLNGNGDTTFLAVDKPQGLNCQQLLTDIHQIDPHTTLILLSDSHRTDISATDNRAHTHGATDMSWGDVVGVAGATPPVISLKTDTISPLVDGRVAVNPQYVVGYTTRCDADTPHTAATTTGTGMWGESAVGTSASVQQQGGLFADALLRHLPTPPGRCMSEALVDVAAEVRVKSHNTKDVVCKHQLNGGGLVLFECDANSTASGDSALPTQPAIIQTPLTHGISAREDTGEVEIKLLMVNDVYSVHNIARLKTALPTYRTPESNCVLTLNGDFLGGFELAVKSSGKAMIACMNQLDFDLVVLGNHEFDHGLDPLLACISESNFEWLGANVVYKDTRQRLQGVNDISVRTFSNSNGNSVTVGFFGVCTTATPTLSSSCPKNLAFLNVIETSQACVDKLKSLGADIIVGITHVSVGHDFDLANHVKGIDVLLGGHDHFVVEEMLGDTLLLKCGQDAERLGVITLRARKGHGRTSLTWAMHDILHTPPAQDVMDIIASYDDKPADSNEVLGTVGGAALDSTTVKARSQGCTFGYLVADAICSHLKTDIGVVNGGFIRANLVYPVGSELCVQHVRENLPFPKQGRVLKMTGALLKKGLDQQLAYLPHESGAFPHVSSGWELVYDSSKPSGERVVALKKNGKEVDDHSVFSVAVPYNLAQGGDSCDAYPQGEQVCVPEVMVGDMTLAYLRRMRDASETQPDTHKFVFQVEQCQRVRDICGR